MSGLSAGEFSPGYYFYNSPPFLSQTRSILGSAYMVVMNYHTTARSAGMLSPTLDDPHFGNLSETRNTQNHVCKFHIYYILRLICKPAPSPHVWKTEMRGKKIVLSRVPIFHTFWSPWMEMGPPSPILPRKHLLYPDAIRLPLMLGAPLTRYMKSLAITYQRLPQCIFLPSKCEAH